MSITSRYQSNPGQKYWIAAKNILKYLRRTKDLSLIFGGAPELWVESYTDSNFMSDPDDRKSISRYVFIYNGGVVRWKYFKQSTIADSTIEAEYVIILDATKKNFWFKKFTAELGAMTTDAISLYCKNNEAIALAKELRSHQKSKHIDR